MEPFGFGVEGRLRGCRVVLDNQLLRLSFIIPLLKPTLEEEWMGSRAECLQQVWGGFEWAWPVVDPGAARENPDQDLDSETFNLWCKSPGCWATFLHDAHSLILIWGAGVLCWWMRRCWGLFDNMAVSFLTSKTFYFHCPTFHNLNHIIFIDSIQQSIEMQNIFNFLFLRFIFLGGMGGGITSQKSNI